MTIWPGYCLNLGKNGAVRVADLLLPQMTGSQYTFSGVGLNSGPKLQRWDVCWWGLGCLMDSQWANLQYLPGPSFVGKGSGIILTLVIVLYVPHSPNRCISQLYTTVTTHQLPSVVARWENVCVNWAPRDLVWIQRICVVRCQNWAQGSRSNSFVFCFW